MRAFAFSLAVLASTVSAYESLVLAENISQSECWAKTSEGYYWNWENNTCMDYEERREFEEKQCDKLSDFYDAYPQCTVEWTENPNFNDTP